MDNPIIEFSSPSEFINYVNVAINKTESELLAYRFINIVISSSEIPQCDRIQVASDCITITWEDDRLYFSFKILMHQVLWVYAEYDGGVCENGVIDNTESEMLRIINVVLLNHTL